jgi:hypothetical protein
VINDAGSGLGPKAVGQFSAMTVTRAFAFE